MGDTVNKQSEKFKRAARELGCDEDEAVFDLAISGMRIVEPKFVEFSTEQQDDGSWIVTGVSF